MKRFARIARVACTSILMVAAARAAGAQGMCRTLDGVPGEIVSPHGINNKGDIVGDFVDGNQQRGFVKRANGQLITIDSPLSTWLIATGINNAGDVVGSYGGVRVCNCVADIRSHGFKIVNGAMSSLPEIGASDTIPTGINAFGTIVGFYHDGWGDNDDHRRGFLMTAGGGVTFIDGPGGGPLSEAITSPSGINASGTVVGTFMDVSGKWHVFTRKAGEFQVQPGPFGATMLDTGGINKAGNFVGTYSTKSGSGGGFIRSPRRYSDFACPNATMTSVSGINDRGVLTGNYVDAGENWVPFYTQPIAFVDPVPDLVVNGMRVTTNAEDLATKGRLVQGAAADGSTIVVIRVPTAHADDQVTLSLLKSDNGNQPATSIAEYGGLATPTIACCEFSVTVKSVNTGNGPTALAMYRVPYDFPRADGSDADKSFRDVYIRVQAPGGTDLRFPLHLIRPLVAAVHGIWGGDATWDAFTPLIAGANNRFQVKRISYDDPLGGEILNANPSYPLLLRWARGNSLGFGYGAVKVMVRMQQELEAFKNGANPEHIAVAATKVDVIAHSMGGDVARSMALLLGYTRGGFGEGWIHKLITIDTPHLGSPLASRLLDGSNSSLAMFMAGASNFIFKTVTLSTGTTTAGAVGDLRPGSAGLTAISGSNDHPIPVAMIVGEYSNWSALGVGLNPRSMAIRKAAGGSNLVWCLTSYCWPAIFYDDPLHRTDGIVSVKSQANGGEPGQTGIISAGQSVVHSDVLSWFGFNSVAVLDAQSTVPNKVIDMLNQPVTNGSVWVPIRP